VDEYTVLACEIARPVHSYMCPLFVEFTGRAAPQGPKEESACNGLLAPLTTLLFLGLVITRVLLMQRTGLKAGSE